MAPIIDEQGQVRRLFGVARNVSERNNLEERLRQAQRLEVVGQLTAGVAHDFNNLVQVIGGSLELMQMQDELPPDLHDLTLGAESATQRAAALTHRLLAVSRKQVLQPELLKASEVVSGLQRILIRLIGNGIRLETFVPENCWPLLADRAQLDMCLLNLAINARDAMQGGGVLMLRAENLIQVRPDGSLAPGSYVSFIVRDTGTGMPPDILARVFEPFFTTKGPGSGTGLGLSTVYGFARQSGGDVWINSVVGEGTRINLVLPRAANG